MMESVALFRSQECAGQDCLMAVEGSEENEIQGWPEGLRRITCEVTGVGATKAWQAVWRCVKKQNTK